MYSPFLYGRGAEMDALADISAVLGRDGGVVPLIEPVKANTKVRLTVERLRANEVPAYVIINPFRGDFVGGVNSESWLESMATELGDDGLARPAYREHESSTLAEVQDFVNTYADRPVAVVLSTSRFVPQDLARILTGHGNFILFFEPTVTVTRYLPHVPLACTITIVDRFRTQATNAEYEGVADEWFGDAFRTWKSDGVRGFSDFTLLPTIYREGGGQAYAVAAHLSYESAADDDMYVRHFVSETKEKGNDAAKILEVADEVAATVTAEPSLFERTVGLQSFIDIAQSRAATNLTQLKRWQIAHHIEETQKTMARQ